jgi:hypothetical protein
MRWQMARQAFYNQTKSDPNNDCDREVVPMGIGSNILREIIDLKRSGALADMNKVVEIGAQQINNDVLRSDALVQEVCGLFGVDAAPRLGTPTDAGYAGSLELQSELAPPSQPFWEALRFEYATIDFGGHRNSRALDLNRDRVPRDWHRRFDLLVNAGTTEHVANQDNAFRVMHNLVRKGGVMIHELPGAGMPTHGLMTYTLKFFWHLCRENDYEVLRLEMIPGGRAPLPGDIVVSNAQFGRGGSVTQFQSEPIRDWAIFASLRKRNDAAYATPLDLPPDAMQKAAHSFTGRGLQWARQQWKRG